MNSLAPNKKQVNVKKQYTVMSSFHEIELERYQWDALAKCCNGNIYQTYDWCHIWWRHYGKNRKLHLIISRTEDRWDGIIAMFSDTIGIKPFDLKYVKPIGGDHTHQTCLPLVEPEALEDLIAFSAEYFLIGCRFDLVRFGPLPTEEFKKKSWSTGKSTSWNQFFRCICPDTNIVTFILPEVKTDYYSFIGNKKYKEYKRKWERGVKEKNFIADVIDSTDDVAKEFERFVNIHQAQWQLQGRCGHFRDWPHSVEFNRDLVKTFGGRGQVRFHRIISYGNVISSQYTFKYGNHSHWRLPARTSDPTISAMGIGKLALIKMIEHEISDGTRLIEGGQGHYPYKLQLGGSSLAMSRISYCRNLRLARFRMHVFFLVSNVIHWFYYKLWYLKILQLIPYLRKPLWSFWIRLS